jgi:hypothetical protein
MKAYQWNFEIIFPAENRPVELVRAGAVITRTRKRSAAVTKIHREIHVRDFFRLRVDSQPVEVRI